MRKIISHSQFAIHYSLLKSPFPFRDRHVLRTTMHAPLHATVARVKQERACTDRDRAKRRWYQDAPLPKSLLESLLERFLGLNDLTPAIVAATGASAMEQLHVAAVGAFHRLGFVQAAIVLAAPLARARFRMFSLRISHSPFRIAWFAVRTSR